MASKSIGSIYAELSLKDKMSPKLKSARKSLNEFGKTALQGAAVGAVAGGFAAIGKTIADTIARGGELNDMMARTGANGEGLYIMGRAFENAGMAAADVPAALNKMQKALEGGSEAFERIGLSVGELKSEDPTKAFQDIASAISSIQDPAARTKAAMDIFGKSGGKMLAVLTDPGAFEQAKEQVGGLGKLFAEHAADLDRLGDSFDGMKEKYFQFGLGLTTELIPALGKFSDTVNEMDLTEAGTKMGVLIDKATRLADALAFVGKFTVPYQLGLLADRLVYNNGNLTDLEKAKTIADQNAESNQLYADSVQKISAGSGSLASPEFQKQMDSWMAAYVESFTKKTNFGEWIGADVGIPEMLQNPEQTTSDIPSWLRKRDQNQTPWESSNYATNDFQARGLALSGVNSTKENKNTTLLSDIRDLLKAIERKRAGEYVYP